MANGKILPGLNSKSVDTDVNLYLLPVMDSQRSDTQGMKLYLSPFKKILAYSLVNLLGNMELCS